MVNLRNKRHCRRFDMRILLACLFSLFTLPLAAQDRPSAILVLDASGSMWGQIDGKAKIEIAQSVVGDLLTDLPAEQALGLTVYGHRVKGDCSDIETLVLPGGDTRAAIASAVNGISPKGKTPLSDAVIQAAEALKYTEEAATVILVTDGLETCERDPCAVGRALEQNGIGFTAHVIGFDVAVEDRDQLQCLADETGGKFLSASNADELSLALTEVAEEPAAPAPVLITFVGAETENGPPVAYDLIWDLSGPDGRVFTGFQGSSSDAQLLPGGTYQITALRPEDSAQTSASFTAPDQAATVTVVLPVLLPQASLSAPDTASIGALVDVTWDGPDAENDYVSVADPEEENRYIRYGYTRKGNPTEVRMPPEPGTYELRYQLGDGGDIIARRMIEVLDVPVTLTAPDTAPVGSVVDVVFEGPDEDRDYISVADPDEKTRYIRIVLKNSEIRASRISCENL
ncbi:MAG: VWA domain-containing protein [Rhodobacteraceae bacterium]|nr:VWA domain-containing protein [Paracoccaceae bacterium]